jgi:hypothetical protein
VKHVTLIAPAPSSAPQDWSSKHNAAFSYYAYYIYANLYVLNKLRESRGLNTFTFRCEREQTEQNKGQSRKSAAVLCGCTHIGSATDGLQLGKEA